MLKEVTCLDDEVRSSLLKIDAVLPLSFDAKTFSGDLKNLTGTRSVPFKITPPASGLFWEVHSIALSPLPAGAASLRKFALVLVDEQRPVATVFEIEAGFDETKVLELPGYIRAESGELFVLEPDSTAVLIPRFELRGRLSRAFG
jgi:hypothetical protein